MMGVIERILWAVTCALLIRYASLIEARLQVYKEDCITAETASYYASHRK
jgi:hypothetical protein